MSVTCTSGNSTPIFSLGGLYRMDEDTQIKVSLSPLSLLIYAYLIVLISRQHFSLSLMQARINNKNMIGLALVRTLRPGIAVTLNAIIDGKNFNQGGHKLGMGIDLEA